MLRRNVRLCPVGLLVAAAGVSLFSGAFAQAPALRSLDPVLVTGNPLGSELIDMVPPASVLSGDRLLRAQQPTLGEIVGTLPGVSSSYFGPNASRPVIRGLDGERVRVLQNGIGVLDASGTSPDHAVALDPLTVRRIEIVRGPASLLYGPSAIGGVVNVIDNRIPSEISAGATGAVHARYGSSTRERSVGGVLDLGHGSGFNLHLDAFTRRTDDLRIPDFAYARQLRDLLSPDEQGPRRVLPNSASDSDGAAIGASYVGRNGYGGLSYSEFNSDYGTVAEETVTIGLKQKRFDAAGEIRDPFAFVKSVKARFGQSDYTHTEFEGDEVGTVFRNKGYEGRVDVTHAALGPLEGVIGFQVVDFDFSARGEEVFLPDTQNKLASAFVFEEYRTGPWRLQFGARYDRSKVTAAESALGEAGSRTFSTGSGSIGAVWSFAPAYALAASYVYSQRPPNYQELFANGPHLATGIFEVGDRGLRVEKSSGVDFALRKIGESWSGSVGVFYSRFHDYIALFPTGDVEDDLPVFVYRPIKATLYGIEAEGRVALGRAAGGAWDLELRADWLRGRGESADAPLPRITPPRFGAAVAYAADRWEARLDVLQVLRQNRVVPGELPTDAYTMLNASVTGRVNFGQMSLTAFVQGVNLLDEDARVHASFLKDIAPLARRGVVAGLRGTF